MPQSAKFKSSLAGLLAVIVSGSAWADDVQIKAAEFRSSGAGSWQVNVTLKHGDTGWDHYADNWRVVDAEGNVLGDRVLYHPHVDEQPFTRGLGGVQIPAGIDNVYIEAHDKVHGWTPNRLAVDLSKASGGHLRVTAD